MANLEDTPDWISQLKKKTPTGYRVQSRNREDNTDRRPLSDISTFDAKDENGNSVNERSLPEEIRSDRCLISKDEKSARLGKRPLSVELRTNRRLNSKDEKDGRSKRSLSEEIRADICLISHDEKDSRLRKRPLSEELKHDRCLKSKGETPITVRTNVLTYGLQDSCYPSYQYTKKHAATIKDDYIEIKRRTLQNKKPVYDEDNRTEITLCVFEPSDKALFLCPSDLVLRNPENCRIQQMPTNFGEELSQLYSSCPLDSTVVAIKRFVVEKNKPGASLLLLAENKDDMEVFERTVTSDIQVCLKENVKSKISEMLELDILRQIENMDKDLDKVSFDLENQQKTVSITSPCSGKGCCTYESLIEDIKRLRADIKGLVRRSKVPKDQKPQLNTNTEMKVDRKVIDALKKTSDSIDYCGYNLDTLYIFVSEKHPSERPKLQKDIENTMAELSINNFRIVSSHVKLYSSPVSGSGVVVKAMKKEGIEKVSATLTGFGRLREDNTFVAIISRHLAVNSIDKKLYIQNDQSYLTGDIMKELFENQNAGRTPISEDIVYERAGASSVHDVQTQSVEYPKICMDIAFASICEKDEHACDTRYRTDDNKKVKGILCTFDGDEMDRLPVYIWGNATGLSHGIVSMPHVNPVNDSVNLEHFLMIEDKKGRTFCKEGDSGAMVCADDRDNCGDKIQLISMVIGEFGDGTGKYATVKIKEGLEYLAKETRGNIDMC